MSIQLNGTPISSDLIYVQSTYTSVGWSTSVWNFSGTSLPELKPGVTPDYPITGIDYDAINAELIKMNGISTPLSELLGSAKYTPLGWASTIWTFNDADFPSVQPITPPTYPTFAPPVNMEPWILNEIRQNGTPITMFTSHQQATYTNEGWSTGVWGFPVNAHPELKKATTPNYDAKAPTINFRPWGRFHDEMNGGILNSPYHLRAEPYQTLGWNFGTVWGINEGFDTPTPLQYKRLTPVGDHRSSSAWEVLLDSASIGPIYIDGVVYDLKRDAERFSIKGTFVGDIVEHKIQRKAILDDEDEIYVFRASATEDATTTSGYGNLTLDTSRRVSILNNASNDVAFLYTNATNPRYDDLLKIATDTDMIHHVILLKSNASEIRLRAADGSLTTVPLVEVDDPFASPIRVSTENGTRALKSLELNEASLDYNTEIDTALKILYVTSDAESADTRDICNTIRELGHTVIIMSDSYIASKEINTFRMYDMAIVGRTANTSYAPKLNMIGVPVILGYMTQSAISLQTTLGFTDKAYYSSDIHPIGQQVLNNTHPITKDLSATFDAYKNVTSDFISVLDSTGNVVGTPLIKSTGHSLTTNYTMTAHTTSIGTRYVFMGFLYRNVSDTTKLLLDRAIKWVAKKDHLL